MTEDAGENRSLPACRRHPGLIVPALLLLHLLAPVASGQSNTDRLVTLNGNTLTGEIKSLDRGMLRYETDATDTISVQWSYVAALTSPQNLLVTLDDGRQLFGTLLETDADATLRLSTAVSAVDLPILTVVRMTPIEGRLIDRIDMSIDVGYNITKANNVSQTNLGYDFNYRSEERLVSLSLNTARTSSDSNPHSVRNNSVFSYRAFIANRDWDPLGLATLERNDELGLNRRVTIGGGMSRWLTDTNSNRVSFMGGLAATKEREDAAENSDDSVEAAIGLALDWFRYDDPELDVSMQLTVYERLSGDSRTRGNLDADVRWELINDFFLGFSIYYTFNSRPLGTDAERQDYGVTTTIGWSF